MNAFLRNHFQADNPSDIPVDVLCSAYTAAVRVIANPKQFPNADRATLQRLIEEMEANLEINNLMAEQGI